MAFKGGRFAALEWKNIMASKAMKVVIVAIGIIPLLYGALYLFAFLDPYTQLNTVPVAVVNEDSGDEVNGTFRTVGDEVVDELSGNEDGLGWCFVDADTAQKGLEDGTYYMTCTIPSDFTTAIASADTDDPYHAQLQIDYNESSNMLASQIGETVWKTVRQTVSDSVSEEYWQTVFGQINEGGDSIRTASDGAYTLKDGLTTAKDGSDTITTSLGTLESGSSTLTSGLNTLVAGTLSLKDGTTSLVSGGNTLKAGTTELSSGAVQLQDEGTSVLASGASDLSSGASQLQTEGTSALAEGAQELDDSTSSLPDEATVKAVEEGSQQIIDGIGDLQDAAGQLESGASALQTGSAQVAGGISQVQGGLDNVNDGIGDPSDNYAVDGKETLYGFLNAASYFTGIGDSTHASQCIAGAQSVADGLSDGVGSSTDTSSTSVYGGVNQLASGVGTSTDTTSSTISGGANLMAAGIGTESDTESTTLYGGLNNLASGYQTLSSQVSPLVEGAPALRSAIVSLNSGASSVDSNMSTLVSGASTLESGAASVDSNMSTLVSGASQVDAGVDSAVTGIGQLDSGADQLVSGSQSAYEGSDSVTSGAAQLEEGSQTLSDGIQSAVDGSDTLGSSLADGAESMTYSQDEVDSKSDVMSSPVQLDNSYYTDVKNYGTGFAPYFMSLGLWVGALMCSFVFKPLNSRLIMAGGNPLMVAMSNYIPLAIMSLIQATLLMVVLQFGLDLQIDNVPLYYAFGYMVALVFAAIMQLLAAAFGFPGKFIAIILLMLQLTSAAGTFPIEQTPEFFQIISPWLPMTYVVSGMRQIMSGLNMALVAKSAIILISVGVACFFLTAWVAYRRRVVRMDTLHPVLQLG